MPAEQFTSANAISTLLTTESLLFAAFALAINLSTPVEVVRAWLLPPRFLATIAVIAIAGVAFGAAVAWYDIFMEPGFPSDGSRRVVACAVIGAIAIQPLLAMLLALGLRTKR